MAAEPALETTTARDNAIDSEDHPGVSVDEDVSAVENDGDGSDFDFWRDVIGDDIVVGGVVYSADLYTVDGEGVRRLTSAERAVREASSGHEAADRVDRLQERLGDIRETLRTSARERAPTGDASPTGATPPGRQVNPDIGDSAGPSYENPGGTEPMGLADPQYQQSEINPGPNLEI